MPLGKDATPEDALKAKDRLAQLKILSDEGKLQIDFHFSLKNQDAFVFHFINEVRDDNDVPTKDLPTYLLNLGMMLEHQRLLKRMAKQMFGDNMGGLF